MPELIAATELLNSAGSMATIVVAWILWRMHHRIDQLAREFHDIHEKVGSVREDVAALQAIAGVPGGRRRYDPLERKKPCTG